MNKAIFSEINLRHKVLKNRIVFGAHTNNMAVGGLPSDQQIAYYEERAMGGAGMIVVEPMPVHQAAVLTRGNFTPSTDAVIPAFQSLVTRCKAHGAVMIQQLYHIGAHGDSDNSYHGNWSPSGGPSYHDADGSVAMTDAMIEITIQGFVDAAVRCKAAGFDGVEVWAAYHGLLDQFWSPRSNTRTDKWGGSFENRLRFSKDVLTRIRAACGDDFIIGLAVSSDPASAAYLSNYEIAQIVLSHDAEHLMDNVTCGTGSYFNFYEILPSFQYSEKLGVDLAQLLKSQVANCLVTAESHIRTPENAATVLGAGDADLVSIVRGQIADPHWVNKARANRADDIRGCLSCNEMCWGRRGRDYWISCLINPSVGREASWGGDRFETTSAPQTYLVVGAGPAGLEAARAAGEMGHNVTIIEAAPEIGGQFRLAGLQPRRGQITDLLAWYERQLEALGVDLRLNTYWDVDDITAHGADHVILATGSLPDETGYQKPCPTLESLPGLEHGIYVAEDVMRRDAKLGQHVVIYDESGHWKGCGTALYLAQNGVQVSFVTPDYVVGQHLQRSAADHKLRADFAAAGITEYPDHVLKHWAGDRVHLCHTITGAQVEFMADNLIMVTANKANSEIYEQLEKQSHVHLIGDAAGPRGAAFATFEGRNVVLKIAETNAVG